MLYNVIFLYKNRPYVSHKKVNHSKFKISTLYHLKIDTSLYKKFIMRRLLIINNFPFIKYKLPRKLDLTSMIRYIIYVTE